MTLVSSVARRIPKIADPTANARSTTCNVRDLKAKKATNPIEITIWSSVRKLAVTAPTHKPSAYPSNLKSMKAFVCDDFRA